MRAISCTTADRPAWAPLFRDQAAVVTGGARGIGAACVVRLLDSGARVVAVDVDFDGCDLAAPANVLITVTADVTTEQGATAAIDAAIAAFGGVDVLVNNVGGMAGAPPQLLDEYTVEQWDQVVGLNLRPAFLMTRAVRRSASADRLRSIVNIGASLSERSSPHLSAYGAAKSAVAQLTRTLAVELGRFGVRVNCVAPGFTITPASTAIVTPARQRDTERAVPLGRVAMAEEIADVVVFLASDLASFVSGQTLVVDGGLTCTTLRAPRGWDDQR